MFKQYTQLLKEFVALPSVSADPGQTEAMRQTVDWLQAQFTRRGFGVDLLVSSECNPVIVARYDAGRPTTTLVYGHYDVQPAPLEQGWKSNPFELHQREGRFFGRGVADNKGQILIHMVSVFELIEQQQLGCNVTFVIEGDEETANPVLGELLEANQELLGCDNILISDGEQMGDRPALDATLRGGANLRVQLRTGANDLHSGIAGGAVPNAAKVLADLTSSLFNERSGVTVPGFYDGMEEPEPAGGTDKTADGGPTAEDFGVKQLLLANADAADAATQTGLYPTLQISGINSGYTGSGFANIVPATAETRLNLRTVVGQDAQKVSQLVADYLKNQAPGYATIEIEISDPHPAVKLDVDSANAQRARKLLEQTYGQKPANHYVGGAIPVVADFQRLFGPKVLMVGLANSDCAMHGANENFRVDLMQKGLAFSQAWFKQPD